MANTWRLLWPVQSRSEENPGYFCTGGWKQQHKHGENYKVLRIKLRSGTFAAAGQTVSSCRFFIYLFFFLTLWLIKLLSAHVTAGIPGEFQLRQSNNFFLARNCTFGSDSSRRQLDPLQLKFAQRSLLH